jgi:hypothetical protein
LGLFLALETANLIRLKIKRADKHIAELQTAILAFKATDPHEVTAKRDPQTRKPIYYVHKADPVPEDIALIAGDVIQNLRSAVDHLAYQLVLAAGNTPDIATSFPIFDTSDKYESGKNGKVKGMDPVAIKAIDAVEPYKGGKGDILWRLHRLNNIDKHRLIFTCGISPGEFNFGRHIGPERLTALLDKQGIPKPPQFPDAYVSFNERQMLNVGDELFIDAPDAEFNEKIEFLLDIAFSEPGIAEGESIIETIQRTADFVDNLITEFIPFLLP